MITLGLSALSLTLAVIQLTFRCALIFPIRFAFAFSSCFCSTKLATVDMTPVAGPTNHKQFQAALAPKQKEDDFLGSHSPVNDGIGQKAKQRR